MSQSNIVDKIQQPEFIGAAVLTVVLYFVIDLLLDSIVVSIIVALLVSGGIYLLYQDYTEKQRAEDAKAAKEEDLQQRIKEQAKVEQEQGKCISCLAELPEGAEKCPNCGYKVRHYANA